MFKVEACDLKSLVDEYKANPNNSYKKEDEWICGKGENEKNIGWEEAVMRAWTSLNSNGKMHGHQHRIGAERLSQCWKRMNTKGWESSEFQDKDFSFIQADRVNYERYSRGWAIDNI